MRFTVRTVPVHVSWAAVLLGVLVAGTLVWFQWAALGDYSTLERVLTVLVVPPSLVAVFLGHELGHMVGARHAGLRVTGILVRWCGGKLDCDEPPTPTAKLWAVLGGPAASAAQALLFAALWMSSGWMMFAVLALFNFAATMNVLPFPGTDGYHMVVAVTELRSGDSDTAGRFALRVGRLFAAAVAVGVLVAGVAGWLAAWLFWPVFGCALLLGWLSVVGASARRDVRAVSS